LEHVANIEGRVIAESRKILQGIAQVRVEKEQWCAFWGLGKVSKDGTGRAGHIFE